MHSSKGSSAEHSRIVDETLLRIGALPYVRCWKRVVGLFYTVRKDQDTGRVTQAVPVKVGVEGEPDIDGILRRHDGIGQRFGIEIKTGEASQSPIQKSFQRMIVSMGGLYLLARSADHALELLEKARDGTLENPPL